MEMSLPKWVENEDITFCRYDRLVAQICRKNGGYTIYIMCDTEYEKACKNQPHQNLYSEFSYNYDSAISLASQILLGE